MATLGLGLLQAPLFRFLAFSLSLARCSLVVRAAYMAPFPCATATRTSYSFKSFQLAILCCFLPGLSTTRCCECLRRSWGLCPFLLRWSIRSLSSASSCCVGAWTRPSPILERFVLSAKSAFPPFFGDSHSMRRYLRPCSILSSFFLSLSFFPSVASCLPLSVLSSWC